MHEAHVVAEPAAHVAQLAAVQAELATGGTKGGCKREHAGKERWPL